MSINFFAVASRPTAGRLVRALPTVGRLGHVLSDR